MTAVLLAFLAAILFGIGTAMQALASSVGPTTMSPATSRTRARWLLTRWPLSLLRQSMWLVGSTLDLVGALAHITALHYGTLAVVQPIALSSVVFAVAAEAALQRRRLEGVQVLAALKSALGLGAIVVLLGHAPAGSPSRLVALGTAGVSVLALALVLASRRRPPRHQALLLGAAAGSAFGLSASLARTAQLIVSSGHGSLAWLIPTAGVIASGTAGLLMSQAAYRQGRLAWSMPTQDSVALILSLAMGVLFLNEVPRVDPAVLVGITTALCLVTHGISRLARTAPHPVPDPVPDPTSVPVGG